MTAALPDAVQAAGTPVEVWFQDEARVGQQGTLTYVWAETGSRPRTLKDLRYEWAYIFGAVCAERGVGAALVMPHCDTDAMNLYLIEISKALARGAHALLVCDGACQRPLDLGRMWALKFPASFRFSRVRSRGAAGWRRGR